MTSPRATSFALPLILLTSVPALGAQAVPAAGTRPPAVAAQAVPDGQRDFDFEFGTWKAKLSRRLRPLTGSTTWVEYEGTNTVTKVWGGRANLGELEVSGPEGHITGMSLRLYDPASKQWQIRWANAADGQMGPPMIGEFRNGRGEFYNQETMNGRAILVRFIFTIDSPTAFTIEQAFSADGGKSWETNWISRFTR